MLFLKKKNYLRNTALALITLCSITLTACNQNTAVTSNDILTQKVSPKDKKKITVLVKFAFSINSFEKAVEEKFPDIDLVQVGNYTRDMGIAEYAARLEHDDITDIVMTWPLDVGEEYWENRLMDLSACNFTNKYNISMLDDISRNGKLHYLPGPSQVRGIVYNKTLFKERGWEVPTDFESFVQLCHTIEQSGIRALQLSLADSEVLDTAFIGYGFADCFSRPQDRKWLNDYNKGENSFGDHFSPALDTFQRFVNEGILKPGDLNVRYSDREKMLFTRQCAMAEDSVLMARMGFSRTGTTDEYAIMPFFNPNNGGAWARLYMVCYIGLNKHLQEPQNKEKYDLVMKLMDYISTPEGQTELMGDTGAMFSSLIDMDPPDVPEIQDLVPALREGNYGVFPQLTNAQDALRKGLAGMVSGETSKDSVIRMVDEQNRSPKKTEPPQVLGTAVKDFTQIETGSFVTDAMRKKSGCELALFLDNGKDGKYSGKGISARLYKGDVTALDLQRILPDLRYGETGTLWKTEMTGADLINTLEYSIKVDNDIGGWFYYFSGLKMEYAPNAEPGNRIRKLTDENGNPIDKNKLYSVAVMDESVPNSALSSCEKTDISIFDILKETIQDSKNISPVSDGRFIVASN